MDHENSDKTISDTLANKATDVAETEWQPSKHEKAVIYTLAIINLIVSLDATIIVTSLAVRQIKNPLLHQRHFTKLS